MLQNVKVTVVELLRKTNRIVKLPPPSSGLRDIKKEK